MSAIVYAQRPSRLQTRLVVWLAMFFLVAVCAAVLWLSALTWLGVGHLASGWLYGRGLGPATIDSVITLTGLLFSAAALFVFACLVRGTLNDARRL